MVVLIGINVQIGLDAPARFGSIIMTINAQSRAQQFNGGPDSVTAHL